MEINHHARARKAWRHLVKRANSGGDLFTYGELAGKLGLHHRSTSWFLGVIQAHCADMGLPPLQALVVNKKTKLPGMGYRGSKRGKKSHQSAVEQVRAFAWSAKAPF